MDNQVSCIQCVYRFYLIFDLISNKNSIFVPRPGAHCTSFPDKRIRAIKARFRLRGGYIIA